MKTNPLHVGLVAGLVLAVWHACWSGLVATGFAQKALDFVFWAHFITPAYKVEAFDPTRAGILVATVFAAGLALGTVAGAIWNLFARNKT